MILCERLVGESIQEMNNINYIKPCFLRSSYVFRLYTLPSSSSSSSIVSFSKISCFPSCLSFSATNMSNGGLVSAQIHTREVSNPTRQRIFNTSDLVKMLRIWKAEGSHTEGMPRLLSETYEYAIGTHRNQRTWKCRSKFFLEEGKQQPTSTFKLTNLPI